MSPAQFPKDTSVTAPITNSGTSANPQIGLDTSGLITGSKSSSTNQTVSGKLGVSQSGQNHALTASLTSTSGSDITALNVVSSNPDSSAVWISGKEYGHGTLKVSHVQPDGSDANASAVSINLTPNYDYQAVVGTASFASGTNSVSFTPSSGVPTVGQAFRGTGVVSTSTISAVSGSGPYTLTLSSATTGASGGGSYRSYTPTAVQGIYLDTYKSANGSDETSSGTTGTLLNLKNAGSQKLVLDSNGQLQLPQTSSTGGIRFGAGSTASSVYQSSSNILTVNNSALYARPNGTTLAAANETPALFTSAADNGVGPTKSPFTLNSKGKLEWGAEVAAADSPPATQKDVNLYRNAVGELKTDASLTVAGTVAPANLVVQPASNSTTSSLFKASDGATVLGIDTTNKVLTTSTQATTSGTALSSTNKLVDSQAVNASSSLELSTNPGGGGATVEVKASGVTTAKIADSSVTSAKIVNGTIATADIASGAITQPLLSTEAVGDGNISPYLTTATQSPSASFPATKIVSAGTTVSGTSISTTNTAVDAQALRNGLNGWSVPNGQPLPNSSRSAASNSVYLTRFYAPTAITANKISVYVTTASATSTDWFDIGIFSTAGTLLASTGQTTGINATGTIIATLGAGTGAKTGSANYALTAGTTYYIGIMTSLTSGTVTYSASSGVSGSTLYGTAHGQWMFDLRTATGTTTSINAATISWPTVTSIATGSTVFFVLRTD